MKIDRLLTSGLQPKAMDGRDMIKSLQENYGDKIEILAGSGVNALNAEDLMNYTKISQVHSSCKDWGIDKTTCGKHVNYSYGPEGHEKDYDFVSQELVRKLVDLKI